MARQFITGDRELEKTLKTLADKAADQIARSAIGAGLTVMKGAIKKAAPVGNTGMLKKSIGSRFERAKKGRPVVAKAGINIGKRKKNRPHKVAIGPHAHLIALGTDDRIRNRIGGKFAYLKNPTPRQRFTGRVTPNGFVKAATLSSTARVAAVMKKRAQKKLDDWAKALARANKRQAARAGHIR
jgi:hypothetical protein